jgi:hypothetical protein
MRRKALTFALLIIGLIIMGNKAYFLNMNYQTYVSITSSAQESIANYTGTDWLSKYWSKYPDALKALEDAGYDIHNPLNRLQLMKLAPDSQSALTPATLTDLHLLDDSYVKLLKLGKYYLPVEIHAHIKTDGKTYTIRSIQAFVSIDLTYTNNTFKVGERDIWIILKYTYPLVTLSSMDPEDISKILYKLEIHPTTMLSYFDIRVYMKLSEEDAKADDAKILIYETESAYFWWRPRLTFGFYDKDRSFIISLTPRAWSGLVITGKDFILKRLKPTYTTPNEYLTKERIIEILREQNTPPTIHYITQATITNDTTQVKLNLPFNTSIDEIQLSQGPITITINKTTLTIYAYQYIAYQTKNTFTQLPTFSTANIKLNMTIYNPTEISLFSKTYNTILYSGIIPAHKYPQQPITITLPQEYTLNTTEQTVTIYENTVIKSITILYNNTIIQEIQNINTNTFTFPLHPSVEPTAIIINHTKNDHNYTTIIIITLNNTQNTPYTFTTITLPL